MTMQPQAQHSAWSNPPVPAQPRGYWMTQYVPVKTSHILHLLLTLLTFGFWSPVWFILALYNHNRTVPRQFWVPVYSAGGN